MAHEILTQSVQVPQAEWDETLERFSREHRAWLTCIESDIPSSTVDRVGSGRPLDRIEPERAGPSVIAIRIDLGSGPSDRSSIRVAQPTALELETTPDGEPTGVSIADVNGRRTTVRFRVAPSDMLDGMAPGEM